jgi:hypothetical protein
MLGLTTYRQAEENLASPPAEQYQVLFEQKRKEYLAMVPHARVWKRETLEESVRSRIIREFQKEIPLQPAIHDPSASARKRS